MGEESTTRAEIITKVIKMGIRKIISKKLI